MRVHDSQAYRKMDVTRECISRILELRVFLFLSVSNNGPCLTAVEEDGGDKRLVQLSIVATGEPRCGDMGSGGGW